MRLLSLDSSGQLNLPKTFNDDLPPYAVLSHTWLADTDEVTFSDLNHGLGSDKAGYAKIIFCAEKAKRDYIEYFWIDTCCIDKSSHLELSEAITSMFRWYRDAAKCYVYLEDVSEKECEHNGEISTALHASLRSSKWFTRGWTLQEMLAPRVVEFYSREGNFIGTKITLAQQIQEITGVPGRALEGAPLTDFPVDERLRWAAQRQTKKKEDKAYCLLGVVGVYMYLNYGEEDNAFVRLKEEINKKYGTSEKSRHVHWCVSRPSNPLFTGREDLLQTLEHTIRNAINDDSKHSPHVEVISGIGGQGKSEICLQIVRRLRNLFWAVMWVDVSTPGIAESSFMNIAQKLSLSAETLEAALHGISNLKHSWILILDNADDPSINYQAYIPEGSACVVILTSRNDECHQYATEAPIALEGLSEDDSCKVLLKASGIPRDQHDRYEPEARIVAGLLQSHALALIQAGAYIYRRHCTLAQYPDLYKQQRHQLLKFHPTQARSRYGDVYTTFEVSVDMLKDTGTEAAKDALQLLSLLAMCEPGRFPLVVFEQAWHGTQVVRAEDLAYGDTHSNMLWLLTPWHISKAPPFVGAENLAWNNFRLTQALSLLQAYALVSLDSNNTDLCASMHPLVQAWAYDRQTEDLQHTSWIQISCTIALALRAGKLSPRQFRWLLPHLESLLRCEVTKIFADEVPPLVASLIVRFSHFIREYGTDKRLCPILQGVLQFLQLNMLEVKLEWIGLYQVMALSLLSNAKYGEALALQKQVVDFQQQTLAEHEPERLASQHELAQMYRANDQDKEAATLLENTADAMGQFYPEYYPDLLITQFTLAKVYHENEQLEKAATLLNHVIKIQEQTLAEDHPARLNSQHALALVHKANGQAKEATALLEYVVKIERQSLAENDHGRLVSQRELASLYQENGQAEQAVDLLEHIIRVQEQILAENDPIQLNSQLQLAHLYRKNGRVEKAVALIEHVVRMRQTLAEHDPGRIESQFQLANVYYDNGQMEEAVALFEYIIGIQEQTLKEDDPNLLCSQHDLGRAYRANGQVKEAAALLERVVEIRDRVLEEDDRHRLSSRHNLAYYLWALGQHERALAVMQQVVTVYSWALAEDDSSRQLSESLLAEWREVVEEEKSLAAELVRRQQTIPIREKRKKQRRQNRGKN